MNSVIWNVSFQWKLNSRIYYFYDFKFIVFKTSSPPVQIIDWLMLMKHCFHCLFRTSKSTFNLFHYHSVHRVCAFCQLSIFLCSLVLYNPNNCLIILGIQETWPHSVPFPCPFSDPHPQIPSLNSKSSTRTTEEKKGSYVNSPGMNFPLFPLCLGHREHAH